MAKTYTANEIRKQAELFEHCFFDFETADMLRQAADMMDREEMREKKYEYGVRFTYECGVDSWGHSRTLEVESVKHFSTLEGVKCYAERKSNCDAHIIRREVGEWEEVKDGK